MRSWHPAPNPTTMVSYQTAFRVVRRFRERDQFEWSKSLWVDSAAC